MASRNETAARSTKLVKSESSAVFSVSGDSVKIYQKFKNLTRAKSNSAARKLIARKKKTASSKRTLDSGDDADISDDSDADYVHSRSLLRRNIAEFGDERMSDGTAHSPRLNRRLCLHRHRYPRCASTRQSSSSLRSNFLRSNSTCHVSDS